MYEWQVCISHMTSQTEEGDSVWKICCTTMELNLCTAVKLAEQSFSRTEVHYKVLCVWISVSSGMPVLVIPTFRTCPESPAAAPSPQVHLSGPEVVPPQRVDPPGLGALLLPDPGLRGPAGPGDGPVLEARGLEPGPGPGGPQPGPVLGGAAPPAPPGAAVAAAGPLLLPLLPQVPAGTSAGHDAGARPGPALHTQEVEGAVTTTNLLAVTP